MNKIGLNQLGMDTMLSLHRRTRTLSHTHTSDCYNETFIAVHHSQLPWLTLTVLVATIDAQWEGMGDVGSARYEPALLPPCPTIRAFSEIQHFKG